SRFLAGARPPSVPSTASFGQDYATFTKRKVASNHAERRKPRMHRSQGWDYATFPKRKVVSNHAERRKPRRHRSQGWDYATFPNRKVVSNHAERRKPRRHRSWGGAPRQSKECPQATSS